MPAFKTAYRKDPVTGSVSEVKLRSYAINEAVKKHPSEYSRTRDGFAAAAGKAKPVEAETPVVAKPVDKPKAAPDADIAVLREEYKKVVGKKAPGFLKADALRKAIAKHSSGGGAVTSG